MKTYVLFVFAAHSDQDNFVKMISEEIGEVSDSSEVRYFYGPESAIITFKTKMDFVELKELVDVILTESNIFFFLCPYLSDEVTFFLGKETEKHLFGNDKMTGKDDKIHIEEKRAQKLFFDMMKDVTMDECDGEDDFLTFSPEKISDPSLDDILDKISSQGMSKLSEKELSLLKHYSK